MKYIYILTVFCFWLPGFSQNGPTPDMVRQMIAGDFKAMNIEPEKTHKIENKVVEEIPIRLYYPVDAKKLDVIFNIHGGALIAGDLDTHDNISRKLANATKALVIAIDYRKAPENPFPKSLEDVVKVYEWIVKNQRSVAGTTEPISLVSDSGGCLLAAALQLEIDTKKTEASEQIGLHQPRV